MRQTVIKISKIYILFAVFLLLLSCGDNKYKAKGTDEVETLNSGKLEVFVDDAIAPVFDSVFQMYTNERITNVDLKVHKVSARESMAKLLGRKSRVVILARDYLNDEDSLMKINNLKPHIRFSPANEALVFFTNKNSSIDTLNNSEIVSLITDQSYKLPEKYTQKETLKIISRDINTSEFAALKKIVPPSKSLHKNIIYNNDIIEIINTVEDNDNYIGVALYSQIMKNEKVKPIRIGYNDSTGKWISPKPIHPGWFIQDKYPYRVFYYIYLLEDKRDLAYWFSQYCATEKKVVQYYNNYGIVPDYAKFKLHIGK